MWLAFRTTLNDRYNLKTSVELKAICDTTVELVNKHLVTFVALGDMLHNLKTSSH